MHETSLVRSLLKQVKQIMMEHSATSVDSITVEIGPLSGVEAELVRDSFWQLISTGNLGQPQLHVHEVDLQIRCRHCEVESSVQRLSLQCPECQSRHIQILRGDEFRLINVSLQVPVPLEGVEK
ncbi:MAG: hydrogenase maturation nickel metallochaperone HypA [Planctomycetaceae bacterium]